MLKICVALNKEKGFAAFRNRVTMLTMRTIISLRPLPFKISIPKYNHPRLTPCWSLCADLCDFFKEIRKVPVSGHSGLKSRISERMLFQTTLHSPMLKICAALNKENDIASFRNPVPMRTIRTMIWDFYIAYYCIGSLAYPNNREFAQSNRVSGHFCWNYFWEILSYRQREFWRMWNPQNCLFHITDKTLSKALVNIPISWYNLFSSRKTSQKKYVRYETR